MTAELKVMTTHWVVLPGRGDQETARVRNKGLPRNLWVNLAAYGFESGGRRWGRLRRKPLLARPNSARAHRSQGSRGG